MVSDADFKGEKTNPIEANCRPWAGNPKREARYPEQTLLTECDFAEQSQFAKCSNGRKHLVRKGLWR